MRVTLLLFVASILAICCSAQLKKQRLIARAGYYDNTGNGCCLELNDSVFFRYSGSRGSRFDEGIMDYFNPQLLVDGSEIMCQGAIIQPNNVDSGKYTSCAMFDTMWFYTFRSLYGRVLERMETCEYYPDGKPHIATHSYPAASDYTTYVAEYKYFSGHFFSEAFSSGSHTTPSKTTGDRVIIRDVSGNPIIDSFGSHAIHYEYDLKGRYTSKSGGYWRGDVFLDVRYPILYDYYSDGRVRTIKYMKQGSTSSNSIFDYDTFIYMQGIQGYLTRTFYTTYSGKPSVWYYKYNSHLNAAGLKDTVVEEFNNSVFQTRYVAEYNAFGNPISVATYNCHDTSKKVVSKNYYYYELYDADLKAPTALARPYAITVSPNPTTGVIKINFGNSMPPGQIGVQVMNFVGQVVYSSSIALNGRTADIMLGGEIPPGHYAIRMSAANSLLLYKGTIVKY